jgi:OmpA-OmpF porin, OOP family
MQSHKDTLMKTPTFQPRNLARCAGLLSLLLALASPALAQNTYPEEFAKRQAQIDAFKTTTSVQSDANRIYGLGKAQCWLNFSEHEFYRNDRTAVVPETLKEADDLLAQLSPGNTSAISAQTRLVDGAAKIRPDLWDKAANLQATQGFRCAAAATGCAEVLLVQAAHNQAQLGWRYANPYVAMAQDMLDYAKTEEAKCRPVPVVAAAPTPAPAQIITPPAPKLIAIPKVERITLQAAALFKFDKSAKADLLPAGIAQMDEAIAKLKAYKKLIAIKLSGHTDRLGKDSYNYPLSLNRANTVKQYFVAAGIDANKISIEGYAATVSVKDCDAKTDKKLRNKKALQDCLQPNRRVEINFSAEN